MIFRYNIWLKQVEIGVPPSLQTTTNLTPDQSTPNRIRPNINAPHTHTHHHTSHRHHHQHNDSSSPHIIVPDTKTLSSTATIASTSLLTAHIVHSQHGNTPVRDSTVRSKATTHTHEQRNSGLVPCYNPGVTTNLHVNTAVVVTQVSPSFETSASTTTAQNVLIRSSPVAADTHTHHTLVSSKVNPQIFIQVSPPPRQPPISSTGSMATGHIVTPQMVGVALPSGVHTQHSQQHLVGPGSGVISSTGPVSGVISSTGPVSGVVASTGPVSGVIAGSLMFPTVSVGRSTRVLPVARALADITTPGPRML